MRMCTVARRMRNARGTISAAMNSPARASACWNPVNWMTSAAVMTPSDPRASLRTSRNAARMFRLEFFPSGELPDHPEGEQLPGRDLGGLGQPRDALDGCIGAHPDQERSEER